MLPDAVAPSLREQSKECRSLWESDRREKLAGVWLPDALSRKYPTAGGQWAWYWLWPSRETSIDPRARIRRRHHLLDATVQVAVKAAAREAGLHKWVTPPQLRHASAGKRHRYPHRAGSARSRRRFHNHDLHPRHEEARPWRALTIGWIEMKGFSIWDLRFTSVWRFGS